MKWLIGFIAKKMVGKWIYAGLFVILAALAGYGWHLIKKGITAENDIEGYKAALDSTLTYAKRADQAVAAYHETVTELTKKTQNTYDEIKKLEDQDEEVKRHRAIVKPDNYNRLLQERTR